MEDNNLLIIANSFFVTIYEILNSISRHGHCTSVNTFLIGIIIMLNNVGIGRCRSTFLVISAYIANYEISGGQYIPFYIRMVIEKLHIDWSTFTGDISIPSESGCFNVIQFGHFTTNLNGVVTREGAYSIAEKC